MKYMFHNEQNVLMSLCIFQSINGKKWKTNWYKGKKTAFTAFCSKYVYGLAAFAASYQKTQYSAAFAAFTAFAAEWPPCYN